MRIQSPTWPALLRDGGWRELRRTGSDYFRPYFRMRYGKHQTITYDGRIRYWRLRHAGAFVAKGYLSTVLTLADSLS